MQRLSNLKGTRESFTRATLTVRETKIELSHAAMSKLGISDGGNVDVAYDNGDFFIASCTNTEDTESGRKKSEGRKVSKRGEFTHPSIASWLQGQSENGIFEITDNSTEFDNLTWYSLEAVEAKYFKSEETQEETVTEVATEAVVEDYTEEVHDVNANIGEESVDADLTPESPIIIGETEEERNAPMVASENLM